MSDDEKPTGGDRECGLYLHRGLYHRTVAEREVEFVINALRPRQGKVLEVGSGSGRVTRQLALLADSLTVCDADATLLRQLEARLDANEKITYRHLPMERLHALPEYGQFDAAVAVRVVPHAENWRAALDELVAAVRPGGAILVDLWNRQSFVGGAMKLIPPREPHPVHRVTRREIRDAVSRLPVEIVTAYRWGYPRIGPLHLDDLGSVFFPSWAYSTLFWLRRTAGAAR